MSKEVNNYFSEITFESDWQPSQSELMTIFKSVAKNHLAPVGSYIYREEERGTFNIVVNQNAIKWYWNNFPEDRYSALVKLLNLYHYNRYDSLIFKNVSLPNEEKEIIIRIAEACWDAIPDQTTSTDLLIAKISMLSIPINRSINFATKLMEAYISGNTSLADFWKRNGMERSKDPAFYSMIWSKVGRKVGYTDERNSIINAAEKCESFPEQIINDLVSAGHVKNKYSVCSILAKKIYRIKETCDRIKKPYDQEPELAKTQILISRFANSDDYSILNEIIPVLRKQDLVFAAPAAAKHGLGRQLDRYMNATESSSQQYSRY
jgi:hypothetical protein